MDRRIIEDLAGKFMIFSCQAKNLLENRKVHSKTEKSRVVE